MPVIKYNEIDRTDVNIEGVKSITKARVITDEHGWDGHCLRVFVIGKDGFTPEHSHDWEHVIHVIKGNGEVTIDGTKHDLSERDFVYVPPNSIHQFKNRNDMDFEFICIVPKKGDN